MQISIIIPLYKVEKYIERCLQSIVNQTLTDYEVILIDDFSQDNSLHIAELFLRKNNISFQSIKHKVNQKQGAARNNGLKIANGKYIYFMDADDELAHKNTLQLLHTKIEEDNYDFVTAKELHIEDKKEKTITKESSSTTILRETNILKALSRNKISPVVWNKLIQKKFLVTNRIHFFENTYFEDIPYCFTLCHNAKKVALINNITYKYYFQENANATTSVLDVRKIKDAANMCNELLLYAYKNKVHKEIGIFPIHQIVSQSLLYILAHPSVIADKEKWITSYILFQKMYRDSFLDKHKKNWIFSPPTAYYLVKNKYQEKKYPIKGINFIKRILFGIFIRYNFSFKIFY